jgi:steroid delta-isomerase-like uncharacterized protein
MHPTVKIAHGAVRHPKCDTKFRSLRDSMSAKYFTMAVFLGGTSLLVGSEPQATPTIEARNKATAMRMFNEIMNQGRFEVANEIYSPDFQNHGAHRTIDLKTDQDYARAERKAFPDLRVQVERLIADGDFVAALGTIRGTHTGGGYGGLPATGTPIEIRGITIWRIVDGKIRDEWTAFDALDGYSQVVRHVQGKLWIAFGTFLALVVVAERLLWGGCKWLVRLFRHKPKPGLTTRYSRAS